MQTITTIQGETVDAIFAAFDGSTRLSAATGIPVTTVDSWKRARRIPGWRWPSIQAAAERAQIALPAIESAAA